MCLNLKIPPVKSCECKKEENVDEIYYKIWGKCCIIFFFFTLENLSNDDQLIPNSHLKAEK